MIISWVFSTFQHGEALSALWIIHAHQQVVFVFPDQDKRYLVHVRNQVAEVRYVEVAPPGSVELTVNAADWLDLVSGHKNFPLALANGTLSVAGGLGDVDDLLRFLSLFQAEG